MGNTSDCAHLFPQLPHVGKYGALQPHYDVGIALYVYKCVGRGPIVYVPRYCQCVCIDVDGTGPLVFTPTSAVTYCYVLLFRFEKLSWDRFVLLTIRCRNDKVNTMHDSSLFDLA